MAGFWTWLQRKITYDTTSYISDESRVEPNSDTDVLKDFKNISVQTSSSSDTKMWLKKPSKGQKTYIFFGGSEFDPYAENYQDHISLIESMNPEAGIMVVSYPGFAGSKGAPSEKGCLEAGEAAIEYLKAIGVRENQMILSGYSMGAGIAVDLATKHKVAKLNLISPIDTLIEPAKRVINYSFPAITRPLFTWIADNWFEDKFDNISKVKDISPETEITIQVASNDHMRPSSDQLMRKLSEEGKRYQLEEIYDKDHSTVITDPETALLSLKTSTEKASTGATVSAPARTPSMGSQIGAARGK